MSDAVHPEPTGILRPSSAPRWVPCPGSHALEARYPDDEESPEAREGTAAHWWASERLAGRVYAVGAVAPNGHPIDAEMVEAGQVYVDDVLAVLAASSPQTQWFAEKRLTMHALIHPKNEGTTDCFLIDPVRRLIVVWDFKYGMRFVEVYHHWQLVDYFAGICEGYGFTPGDVADWRVEFRVAQPRIFHPAGQIRSWVATGGEVWGLFATLSAAAAEAKRPGAWVQTGAHCRDCNGRHACMALMKVAGLAVDMADQGVPVDLPPDALGREMKRLTLAKKRLEARLEGLSEVALAAMRRGQSIPFWTIGHADVRERWTTPPGEVFALGDMFGVDLRKAPEPVTPAQARKLGVDADTVTAFAVKPTGAAKVVPVDEAAAARAFGKEGK